MNIRSLCKLGGVASTALLVHAEAPREAHPFDNPVIPDVRMRRLIELSIDFNPARHVSALIRYAGQDLSPEGNHVRVWIFNEWVSTLTVLAIDGDEISGRRFSISGSGELMSSEWADLSARREAVRESMAGLFDPVIEFGWTPEDGYYSGVTVVFIEHVDGDEYRWLFRDVNLSGLDRFSAFLDKSRPLVMREELPLVRAPEITDD